MRRSGLRCRERTEFVAERGGMVIDADHLRDDRGELGICRVTDLIGDRVDMVTSERRRLHRDTLDQRGDERREFAARVLSGEFCKIGSAVPKWAR